MTVLLYEVMTRMEWLYFRSRDRLPLTQSVSTHSTHSTHTQCAHTQTLLYCSHTDTAVLFIQSTQLPYTVLFTHGTQHIVHTRYTPYSTVQYTVPHGTHSVSYSTEHLEGRRGPILVCFSIHSLHHPFYRIVSIFCSPCSYTYHTPSYPILQIQYCVVFCLPPLNLSHPFIPNIRRPSEGIR